MSSAETEVQVTSKPVTVSKEGETHIQHDSHDEEYESADDAYEEEEVEEIEIEEEVDEEEEEYEERSPSQIEKDKELDDDEDRKNPQFIPKRGYFYEHDDRTKVEEEGAEEEEPKKEEKKKPVEKEPNRWSHDLYNEEEQTPKSKDELSRAYGYEIWNEEQAPRARRRRRYGRGPNKYTRQWEDEEAYQKPRGGGGFRGRGGRGRGNFRDSKEEGGREEDGFEEEFPALPGQKTAKPVPAQNKPPNKPTDDRQGSRGSLGRRDSAEDQPQKQHHHQQNQQQDNRRDGRRRYEQHDNRDDNRNGPRGGGGGGRGFGGGRGRGRRNEFSNRNRYGNRREDEETNQHQQQERTPRNPPSEARERPDNRVPPRNVPAGTEARENQQRGPPPASTNGHARERELRPKDSPLTSKPPFTNTEYTGSHSLTANRQTNRSQQQHNQQNHQQNHPQSNKQQQSEEYDGNQRVNRGSPQGQSQGHQGQAQQERNNGYPEKPIRDLRDVINARRMQQQQQQQPSPNDRRSQMPPRLQQQAQQQQQQQQQIEQVSAKPKRFSAQRQRQVEPSMVNSAPIGVIPTSSVGIPTSVPMSHGVPPNMIPVVTGTEQLVPSPVPVYPQAPTYYDNGRVYEASGSPVTVVTVTTDGPSGTPPLWAPHAYANVPYPSPPTGPQVPQPGYTDHPAYITAQQPGPIYSAPPQFIQDPSMMNYQAAAPPFAPAYHPQTFQGYPQVTPAPPPEVYHGGVTYYSPQTQIQRQPMMVSKRTKTVLQLVEPPEKSKGDNRHVKEVHQSSSEQPSSVDQGRREHQQGESKGVHPMTAVVEASDVETELVHQLENVNLQQPPEEPIRKSSPLPPQESWSAQMEEVNSPTESPEISFQKADVEPSEKSEKAEKIQRDQTSPQPSSNENLSSSNVNVTEEPKSSSIAEVIQQSPEDSIIKSITPPPPVVVTLSEPVSKPEETNTTEAEVEVETSGKK